MRIATVRRALCGLVLAAAALAAAGAASAATPTIYFHYAPNCTFSVVDDNGSGVTTIAPGNYQLIVDTPFAFSEDTGACSYVQFDLTGPGVSVTTTLGTGDSTIEQFSVTFKPSSTYVAQDDQNPTQTRKTFATAASGTPVQVAAAGSGPTSSSGSSKASSSGGSTSAIGTAIPSKTSLKGTLRGVVGANGALTLTKNGKAVQILPAGRYDLSIVDQSRSSGFTIQAASSPPIVVTAGAFTGKKTKAITLNKGQWLFYGSFVGKKTYFIVTA